MTRNLLYLIGIIILLSAVFGCSGKSGSPVTPDTNEPPSLTGSSQSDAAPLPDSHELLSVWHVIFNPDSEDFELVGLREADFHLNIMKFLQPPLPMGLTLDLNSFDLVAGLVDVDIAITHPLPATDYRTFDTKLIVMGMGDIVTSGLDPGLTYPAQNGFRLINADGYTRWWNATEFTTEGFFGFYPSSIGTQPWPGNATLNGYKYYADPLLPADPVVPKVKMSNRGTFSTAPGIPKLQRNFQLQFPIDPGSGKPIWMFQLAVDACWDVPTGNNPPPKTIDDFPIGANCPEAFHIRITTDGSTAYYDNGDAGGDLVLQIEVFDWGAPSNINGINGEISEIKVESETLFDTVFSVTLDPDPGSQLTSGIYNVTIPNVHPTSLEDQEIVVMVASLNPSTYAAPGPAFTYPASAKLAAYKIVEVPISDTPPIPDTITVEIPNGGEIWEPGESEDINWASTGNIGANVSIGYTLSGGLVNQIIASTPNDGEFTWDPIPDISSEEVKIVARSVTYPAIMDESDDFFTIMPIFEPEIILTSPNGGEVWIAGDPGEITWETVGPVSPFVSIGYTISDGPVTEIEAWTDNDGSYFWDPIPDIDSTEVKILVADLDLPGVEDESDNFFTIQTTPLIVVTVPNGGETWYTDDSEEITWDSFGPIGDFVTILYSVSDGVPVMIEPAADNTGNYLWDPIPDLDSTEVRIIVSHAMTPIISDSSDEYFTIEDTPPEPEIIVTSPNGGEVWAAASAQEITWDSIGDVGEFVSINFTLTDGAPLGITPNTENDGSFMWDPIPSIDNTEVRVQVVDNSNPLLYDASDSYFTIEFPSDIVITQPNGTETLVEGESYEIFWISGGSTGPNVSIYYSISDGAPVLIEEPTENDGAYTWDPIPSVISDEVRVIVADYDNPATFDESDEYFSIISSEPVIEVIDPDGFEEWVIGSSEMINWTSQNITGDVSIFYKLNPVDPEIEIIAATENDGQYEWNPIPAPETDQARVIITSIDDPGVSDESDNDFTIWDGIEDTLTLTSPNGGEVLSGGGTWEITWDWTGDIANVSLHLSTDSGATYPNNIVFTTPCDGSYVWDPVDEIDVDTARIKVEWSVEPLVFDESDADFSIDTGAPHGWEPIGGQTGVGFPDPIPFQDDQPADIAIWSAGDDETRCEFIDQNDDVWYTSNNDYSDILAGTWAWMLITDSVHKFDILPDGSWAFVTNAESAAWNDPWVKDPRHCVYSSHEVDGTGFNFVITGDFGDQGTGTEDPDLAAWLQAVDFDCGVPGGISDDRAYMLHVFSPGTPVAHDGRIRLVTWDGPDFGATEVDAWFFSFSTQGGTTPVIDDTVPLSMALGVDDDSHIHFGDDEIVPVFWILDSAGVVTGIAVRWSDGNYLLVEDQLESTEFGTATPVDVTVGNAAEFGYSVSANGTFNWICILLDNGDGTWSVGIWECDFIDGTYTLIDITDPLPGIPMAVDFDGIDFELHVLADNGGAPEVTVFEYIP